MRHPELSPSFYELVLDNVHDGVYCTDTQRRILYWNRGAENFTGFEAAEVVGKRCGDNVLNHVVKKAVCCASHTAP
ncbi:MAG: PAS domain-containing protein [Armatimonadota bacterium]|nr:PAS domain-containing protein [Armatimonadota bacterium]